MKQERYESSFLLVSGDLKKPIAKKYINRFLENLFPSFPYRISSYNVKELLDVFGRNGMDSEHVFWSDFRKTIRERKLGSAKYQSDALFFKSVLNQEARVVKVFRKIMSLIGFYYFIMVPVRLAFNPWNSMLDIRALCSDLVVDSFVFLNLLVLINKSYKNKKEAIITERMKILRRINYNYVISAVPFDWYECAGKSKSLLH